MGLPMPVSLRENDIRLTRSIRPSAMPAGRPHNPLRYCRDAGADPTAWPGARALARPTVGAELSTAGEIGFDTSNAAPH